MAEKELKTRIQLKYDTLANWNASNFSLKAGEVAIATTGDTVSESIKGDNKPVLMKVGPGVFRDLPWLSALAADVYDWAKQTPEQFAKYVKGLIEVTDIDAYSKGEVDNLLAANSAADQKYAKDYTDAAIAGLDSTKSQTAGADGLALSIELTDGKVTALSGSIAANTYDAYGSAAAAEGRAATDAQNKADAALASAKTYAEEKASAAQSAAEAKVTALENGQVKANKEAIAAINDSTNGILAQAKADATSKANAAQSAAEATAAGALDAYKTSNNKALADEIARAKEAEAAALKAAQDAQADIDAFMSADAVVEGAIDTLKEINKYITDDTAAFTALSGRVTDLENGDTAAKEAEHADKADVASSLDAAGIAQVQGIKVNNATNADKADSLTDNAKNEVKGVKVDNATQADKAADSDKLGGVAAADYALKTYVDQAESDANKYTDDALKSYYTKSEADAAFMDSTETGNAIDAKIAALNLATTYEPIGAETRANAYADSLAGNYATAAQGAKADSALQEVEAGVGLKVSAKSGNKQTISIDESVVFVFDCGSATVNIN